MHLQLTQTQILLDTWNVNKLGQNTASWHKLLYWFWAASKRCLNANICNMFLVISYQFSYSSLWAMTNNLLFKKKRVGLEKSFTEVEKICYNNSLLISKPAFGVQDLGCYSSKHLRICLILVVSVRLEYVFRYFTE